MRYSLKTVILDPRIAEQRQAIDTAWRDLLARATAAGLGHDPDWFWPTMDWLSPPERQLRFLLMFRGDRAVGLFPLERRKLRAGSTDVRCIGFLSHPAAPAESALLVDPDAPEAWEGLARHLVAENRWWQCLSLDGLCAGGSGEAAVKQKMARSTVLHVRDAAPQYFVEFAGNGDAYFAGRRQKVRGNFRRAQRRLEALGRLEYTSSVAGEPPSLNQVEMLDKRTWRMDKPEDVEKNAALNAYCRSLFRIFPRADLHQLRYLLLDGTPIAANYTFWWGGIAYPIKNAFDAAFEAGSPGMVLLAKVIMEALDQSARRVELQAGNWYVMRLATSNRATSRDLLFRRSNLGLLYGLLARGRSTVKRRLTEAAA